MTLTDQTYEAIRRLIDRNGIPPTLRELGKELGLSSTDSVRERLLALKAEGRIDLIPGSPRAIIIKDRP